MGFNSGFRTEETMRVGPEQIHLRAVNPTQKIAPGIYNAHTLYALLNTDVNDLYILKRPIHLIRLHVFDPMDDLQPRNRPSKNRVLLVQPRRSRRRNKELTPVRPRSSVRHANRVRPIVLQIVTELIFKLFSPNALAPGTVSEGVSGLDHEFRNDAVEDHALEVSASSVTDEILNGQRSLLREQPHVDVPDRRVDRRLVSKRRWTCAL